MENVMNKVKGYGIKICCGIVAVVALFSSYGYNDGGVSTRIQMPMVGHSWVKEEGYYFKMPFISRVSPWNQKGTVAVTDNKELIDSASIVQPPTALQFADSYEMKVEWSLRYAIPLDDESLEKMYKSLKSQDNLLGNTLMPFGQTLVNDSVNQMLGGNFAQGGRNALRTLIDNQSQNGMYQTRVMKVKQSRDAGEGSNHVLGGTSTDIEITKVVYIKDALGKKLRTPLSIGQYGVKIVPNSIAIVETKPLGKLVTYITTKQTNIALQIAEDEKQKLLTKQSKSAQLLGDKNLVTVTNQLNITKQSAIIAAEQRVAEAELQAEKEIIEQQKIANLAVINKNRELQISKANEGIQKANATAAKYEAQAIKQVGFAEAAVKKADYAAIDKEILISNNNRKVAIAMYGSNMTVNLPKYLNIGGEAAKQTSVEQMSTLKMMEQLQGNTGK